MGAYPRFWEGAYKYFDFTSDLQVWSTQMIATIRLTNILHPLSKLNLKTNLVIYTQDLKEKCFIWSKKLEKSRIKTSSHKVTFSHTAWVGSPFEFG